MEEVRIKVRINGPYRIEGPAILEDADGNRFQLPEGRIALCRCGFKLGWWDIANRLE